jgi:hypothetical protein
LLGIESIVSNIEGSALLAKAERLFKRDLRSRSTLAEGVPS